MGMWKTLFLGSEVTSGQDGPPCFACPFPPHLACLQQARADQAEREAEERKKKRQPGRSCKPCLPPQDCVVGIA